MGCGLLCWILVFFLEKDMSFIERPSSQIIETKLDDLVSASLCGVFNGDEETTRELDEDAGESLPGVNVDRNVVPIQEEVDESGFPSPQKTRAHENVDDSGIPSSSITNKAQKGEEQSEQTADEETGESDELAGESLPAVNVERNVVPIQEEVDESGSVSFNLCCALPSICGVLSGDEETTRELDEDAGESLPGVNVDRNVVPIQEEVDESGFPSPRKTRAHENVDDSGIPSSTITNKAQKGEEQSEQTADEENFHQFDQDWEHNFLPLPGVKWNTSTKRSNGALPPLTDDNILATFVNDGDTAVPSSAWGDTSSPDYFEASSSPERTDSIDERKGNTKEQQPIAKEGNAKEQQPIAKPSLRQEEKKKEKVSPAMELFSDGDLSYLGDDISDAEATVGTTTHLKRGLSFFKKRGRRYHSEGERSDSEWDTDMSKNSPRLKALSPLRRKNKQKKQMYKTNETRRKLFGSSPKKAEKSPTRAKKALSDTNLKPSNPRNMATPVASNVMKTPDSKPILSVDVNESGATDDKTVSTLGSIITRETSSKAGAKVASSSASANTAMSEIERLRKENDKLRQELERQAARRENERLRQELEKRAANEAASAHPPRHHDGSNERGDEKFPVKKNSPNGLHKSTLSSLLESDMKAKQHSRRHRVTKNHLMNQADFDDESITTYSPTRPNRHFDYMSETTGTEILSRVAGATGWVTSQVRNAANGQGQRPLDCFTACARNGRGRRRRRGAKGDHDDSESDTDSLEDDSLFRSGGRPRPPIARRRRGNANRKREQFL